MGKIFIVAEGEEQICDHNTRPTGERDEEDRLITKCIHCGKEFVRLFAGRKRNEK